jgi:hypothetical protein
MAYDLPPETAGLRLCKIFPGDDLRLCETVLFTKGRRPWTPCFAGRRSAAA